MLQIQGKFGPGTQHLQTTDLRGQLCQWFGQEGLVIVPRTDHDLFTGKGPSSTEDTPGLDLTHQCGKVKLDAQLFLQVGDQHWDRFTRVQLLIVQPEQGCAMVAELAATEILQRRALQQFHAVIVLDRTTCTECLEQCVFLFSAGKQDRAVALELEVGLLRPPGPDASAGLGQFEHLPRWLARDQGLAEVAHRCTERCGAALENPYAQTTAGGGVGVGQAEDACANDQDVALVGHIRNS
ncbi:hypothetical protein D9M71_113240 [compost metagenome]